MAITSPTRRAFTGLIDDRTMRPMTVVVGEPDPVIALGMARTALNADAVEYIGMMDTPFGKSRRYRTSMFARPLS